HDGPVGGINAGRANPDQHLVDRDLGLVDVAELHDVGGPVPLLNHCLHGDPPPAVRCTARGIEYLYDVRSANDKTACTVAIWGANGLLMSTETLETPRRRERLSRE